MPPSAALQEAAWLHLHRPRPEVLTRLHHALVVSVQADEGSPLRDPAIIAALALAAEQGGAAGLRVRSCEDVRAVRQVCGLPIIGLTKRWREGSEVYVTHTPAEVPGIARRCHAGAATNGVSGAIFQRAGVLMRSSVVKRAAPSKSSSRDG